MLSFSQGRRVCIGQSFARAELACLLVAWISRFRFWHGDRDSMALKKIKVEGGITSRPAAGKRLFVRGVSDT